METEQFTTPNATEGTEAPPQLAPTSAVVQEEPFPFFLTIGELYEGPLDVLLALIRKQDIDIYDIPIALITSQFLACIRHFRPQDAELAGEFLHLAAQLIHIKSKILLPANPGEVSITEDDPRRELVNRLLELEQFKQAAQMLNVRQQVESSSWSKPGMKDFLDEQPDAAAPDPIRKVDTFDLVAVFREVAERAANRPALNVESDVVTVGQMVEYLRRRLEFENQTVTLSGILNNTASPQILTAAFLALLEMGRVGAILLRQDSPRATIRIKKTERFEEAMSQTLTTDWV
jgi:segregation and condensation protein A